MKLSLSPHPSLWFKTAALPLLLILLLSGCTVSPSAGAGGLLPHLNADLQLPAELVQGQDHSFEVKVEAGGAPLPGALVTFEFWLEDEPDSILSIPAVSADAGRYTVSFNPDRDGLYQVRSRISSGSLESTLTQRFAIGEAAVTRLIQLEQDTAAPVIENSAGGHHH
ncbi:FixH family protein [Paenibacillus sp. JSM ZJ436]|uniref:FixH family protein n=1 Tax=Paenibacillus sp. JSM ZJ436 TaxID=3376190 RepID=UPI0037985D76